MSETKIMLRDWMELTVKDREDGYASLTVKCLPVPPDNHEATHHSYLRIAPEHRPAVALALLGGPEKVRNGVMNAYYRLHADEGYKIESAIELALAAIFGNANE